MTEIANNDPSGTNRETIRDAHNPKLVRNTPKTETPTPPPYKCGEWMDARPLGE